jgi:pimeloyl-ACP methyl ester carboxylesterase
MIHYPERLLLILILALSGITIPVTPIAETGDIRIGIVLMHGKGGSPTKYVLELDSALEKKGFLVANLEMPWSGKRNYDVNVSVAEQEVESALTSLRSRGAQKFFVAGHSLGGLFALYFGGRHVVDGIIAIAPGGNAGGALMRDKLGGSVDMARKLVADGKGEEKVILSDYEGTRGIYPVNTTPAAYLSWFDPDGAMNETLAVKNMNPAVPVLFIAPKDDYPVLIKTKRLMFNSLPGNQLSILYEPDSGHLDAPSASIEEIIRWTMNVAIP